jgi:hypothetical protein
MSTKAERRERIAAAVLAALVGAAREFDDRFPGIAVSAANSLLDALDEEAAKDKPHPPGRATRPSTRPRRKILDDVD